MRAVQGGGGRRRDPDELQRRTPPQSREAEIAVLGAVLCRSEAIDSILEVMRPDDFYSINHRQIFAGMVALNAENKPIDLVTLSEELKRSAVLSEVGGTAYLAEIQSEVPTSANAAHYAKIVAEKAVLRGVIAAATEIAYSGYERVEDVDDFVDGAERKLIELRYRRGNQGVVPLKDIITSTLAHIEVLYQRADAVTGVPTGYYAFDRILGGLQPSDLIVIAARPSMGKTAFALNIAQNAALASNVGVLIFSLEMSQEQLGMRLLTGEARVDHARLREGHGAERDFPKLAMAGSRLYEAPIFIDDTPSISVLELRAKARRIKRDPKSRLGLIVVDYLQLMKGPGSSREQEVAEISRSLKALAKELHVPVVALSQLNRQIENRSDKRPMMSDLRESGAIEQDADVIVFLYRPYVYDDKADPRDAQVIVGKQRNGPVGTVNLLFFGECTRFENPTRDSEYTNAPDS